MQGNRNLIVYVITYGPESPSPTPTRLVPVRYRTFKEHLPLKFQKAHSPEYVPLQNSPAPTNFREASYTGDFDYGTTKILQKCSSEELY